MNIPAIASTAVVSSGAYAGGARGYELLVVALACVAFCCIFKIGKLR